MTNDLGEWTVATSRVDLLSRINDADKRYEVMFNSLRDLTLTGLAAQKENVAAALVPVKEALIQARSENDKRFDDLRKEADARDRAMSDKLDALTLVVTGSQAAAAAADAQRHDRRGSSALGAQWIFGSIGVITAILVVAAEFYRALH